MKSLLRSLIPLISVVAPLIIGVNAIHAANLKDIRVGEYDTHTRIVFELSKATVFERRVSQNPGQMTLVFANTQPQLVRKIPLGRAKHVKAIKLMRRQDSLSSVLTFSFDHFRYELIEYQNPFRVAVDIYHLASAPQPPVSNRKSDPAAIPDAENTLDQSVERHAPTPMDTPLATAEDAHPPLNEKTTAIPPADKAPTASVTTEPPLQPAPRNPLTRQTPAPPGQINDPDTSDLDTPDSFAMQRYLVMGMVIMTIIILILLLLMLIFKQPQVDENSTSADDNLKRQDKRIAALNAKIHEQLKRYDEA